MRIPCNNVGGVQKIRVVYEITSILLICILLGGVLIGRLYSRYAPPSFFFKHASFRQGVISAPDYSAQLPSKASTRIPHERRSNNFRPFSPSQSDRDPVREVIGRMFGILQRIFQQLASAPRNLALRIVQWLALQPAEVPTAFIPQPSLLAMNREEVVMPANQSLYQLEILRI